MDSASHTAFTLCGASLLDSSGADLNPDFYSLMKTKSSRTLLFSSLLLTACAVHGTAQNTEAAKSSVPAKVKIDVCSLLTSADVEAAQAEPVKETTPSTQPGGGMLIFQCLFRTPTFAKSVTLTLAAPDPANAAALTPRKFWRQQFHPKEKKSSADKTSKSDPEGEQEAHEPRPVGGIGEEAYWVGDRMTGALYILQGDLYLRMSVGGIRDESARSEKTKALARAAIKRLPAQKTLK